MPKLGLRNTLCLCAFATLLVIAFPRQESTQAEDQAAAEAGSLPDDVAAVLAVHCSACHGPEKQKGGIRLDTLDPDFVNGIHAEDWHDVLNVIQLGEMPPKERPALTDRERRTLVDWITRELGRAKKAKAGAGGEVVLRRLTRYEYNNTMADLLGVELDYAANLPPDSKSKDGFENNGMSMGISPIQLEYYLKAARLGLAKAIVEGDRPVFVEKLITKSEKPGRRTSHAPHENGRVMPGQAFNGRTLDFPREGVVRIKVEIDEIRVPASEGYPRMVLQVGHRADTISPSGSFAEGDVIPDADGGPMVMAFTGRIEEMPLPGHNPKFPGIVIKVANGYDAGPGYAALKRKHDDAKRRLAGYEKAKARAKKQGKPEPKRPDVELIELPQMPSFVVKSITFEGPVVDAWPPSHHRQILFDRPASMDEPAYARAVLERFIARAYRRPATAGDVERVFDFYKSIRPEMPSFESAIRESLAMVLISPEFLYLVEPQKVDDQPQRLTDHERAARLSYLLWSTMPDAVLRDAADKGLLSKPGEMAKQARRMIRDERSDAFVHHFTSQWLDLSGVDRVAVNPQYYPGFDDALKPAMKQETVAFFREVLRSDLSAMSLIESDFVMVNRALALHYGLPAPKGSAFERVDLKGDEGRGGLLTQASVLLMNSNGEDSHPIRRAVWLRDRLLDDPPAPPPPDVPDLEADDPEFASLPLKKQLELHRQKPACMDCHARIDPWGIPFEHYDAVGRYRDQVVRRVGKKTINADVVADAVMPDGKEVAGIGELKAYLNTHQQERFARGLVRRLLSYSLGRSLTYADRDDVDMVLKRFQAGGCQIDELIVAITETKAFNTK